MDQKPGKDHASPGRNREKNVQMMTKIIEHKAVSLAMEAAITLDVVPEDTPAAIICGELIKSITAIVPPLIAADLIANAGFRENYDIALAHARRSRYWLKILSSTREIC